MAPKRGPVSRRGKNQRQGQGGGGGQGGHRQGRPQGQGQGRPQGRPPQQRSGGGGGGPHRYSRQRPHSNRQSGPIACPMCGAVVPDLKTHIRQRHDDPESHPRQ